MRREQGAAVLRVAQWLLQCMSMSVRRTKMRKVKEL